MTQMGGRSAVQVLLPGGAYVPRVFRSGLQGLTPVPNRLSLRSATVEARRLSVRATASRRSAAAASRELVRLVSQDAFSARDDAAIKEIIEELARLQSPLNDAALK